MPRGFWLYWASVLPGMGSRSIPTRRASSTSASSGRRAPTTRLRGAPRSTSLASLMSGASRAKGSTWSDRSRPRAAMPERRYARALAGVTDWCRNNRHRPIAVQQAHLSAMMRGHYAYSGVTGNSRRVRWYAHQVVRIWQRWLSRRDRQSAYTWTRLTAFLKQRPLPPPRIIHRYGAGSEALS